MSTQDLVAAGVKQDYYYVDPSETGIQAIPTVMNTKYRQAFTSLSGGVQTFTFPATQGLNGIVLVMQLPAIATPTGLSANRGWGYQLINNVQYRIAGSSQYQISGAQCLQEALSRCPNNQAIDNILSLGGSPFTNSSATLQNSDNYAYCWISLPYTTPTVDGKKAPLPTDTLVQSCIVQVDIAPLSTIFNVSVGAVAPPTALASGEFVAQQVALQRSSDALAQRVDLRTHSYAYPCEFVQQEIAVTGISNDFTAIQTQTLSGLRAGRFKRFNVWLTNTADVTANVTNATHWYAPLQLTLLISGEVYAQYDAGSSALWNLVNDTKSPVVNDTHATFTTPTVTGARASQSQWAVLPLSQAVKSDPNTATVVKGLAITSGIITLQFSVPNKIVTTNAQPPANTWVLHVSPVMESTMLFSQGTCDFSF
jgi:hypothetical protein